MTPESIGKCEINYYLFFHNIVIWEDVEEALEKKIRNWRGVLENTKRYQTDLERKIQEIDFMR